VQRQRPALTIGEGEDQGEQTRVQRLEVGRLRTVDRDFAPGLVLERE